MSIMNPTLWGFVAIGAFLLFLLVRACWRREPTQWAQGVLDEIVRTGTSRWFEHFIYVRHRNRAVEGFRKRVKEIVDDDPEGFTSVSPEGRERLRPILEEMNRTFGSGDARQR